MRAKHKPRAKRVTKGKGRTKPIVVVIKASTWARGVTKNNQLLSSDNRRCCLGFDGLACGIEDDDLLGRPYPSSVRNKVEMFGTQWMLRSDSHQGDSKEHIAAAINDAATTTDNEKLAALRPIFASLTPPRIIRWLPNA